MGFLTVEQHFFCLKKLLFCGPQRNAYTGLFPGIKHFEKKKNTVRTEFAFIHAQIAEPAYSGPAQQMLVDCRSRKIIILC